MEFDTKIEGVKDLDRTFMNLPRAMQRKVYTKALRAGAAPVKEAAENNIRAVSEPFSGLTRKRGTIRVYKLKNYRGNFRVGIQVKRGLTNTAKRDGDGNPVRVGLYLSVLEYGKQGQAPRSWIRKAIRENQAEAISKLTSEMNKRMVDAIKDARAN